MARGGSDPERRSREFDVTGAICWTRCRTAFAERSRPLVARWMLEGGYRPYGAKAVRKTGAAAPTRPKN